MRANATPRVRLANDDDAALLEPAQLCRCLGVGRAIVHHDEFAGFALRLHRGDRLSYEAPVVPARDDNSNTALRTH